MALASGNCAASASLNQRSNCTKGSACASASDHAGGAGQLMARFPNARLTVHPRGARHIIDPSRLMAATVAIYGEAETRRLYGEILPVPRERVLETPEGATLRLAGRELLCLDAHAELGERHRRAGAERKRLLTEGVRSLVLDERARQKWRLPSEKVLEVFALDIELNAQGLESWLDAEGK